MVAKEKQDARWLHSMSKLTHLKGLWKNEEEIITFKSSAVSVLTMGSRNPESKMLTQSWKVLVHPVHPTGTHPIADPSMLLPPSNPIDIPSFPSALSSDLL